MRTEKLIKYYSSIGAWVALDLMGTLRQHLYLLIGGTVAN